MATSSGDNAGRSPIGLIAGGGQLPIITAQGMHASGRPVCCVGLRDQYDARLPGLCSEFREAGVAQPGRWLRAMKRWGVREAVMVGFVAKQRIHDPMRIIRELPDWRAINIWYRRLRHDRRNAVLLAALADELAAQGVTLIDSTTFIPEHLATPGPMGRQTPSTQQQRDIDFGWPLLKRTVELHIGQSIAVREGDVIAVEAVEGTMLMIKRAGELCRSKGWTLLKTSAQDHDMRADVPTIGIDTIEQASAAGCGCIALGTGRVILIDKPQVIDAADKAGIAIVGVT